MKLTLKLTPTQKKWALMIGTFFAIGVMESLKDGLTAQTAIPVLLKAALTSGLVRVLGALIAMAPTHRPEGETRDLS